MFYVKILFNRVGLMSGQLDLSDAFKKEDFYKPYRRERKGYAKIRLLAMHHLQRGFSTQAVAQMVGYPRQTIWEWIQWYEKGRLPRLQSRPHNRGRKSKLSPDQEAKLKDEIAKIQNDRSGGRITGEEISQHIEKVWGVRFAPGSIYVVLKRLDLVWITGRSRHPKADPELQESFKK